MYEVWSSVSSGTKLGVGSGTVPSKHWSKQELLCAEIAQPALVGGARPGRGSAWPPPDSYFFLLLPVRTFSSWVTLKQFVRVQGKKQNPKIFLRNSLLVRQKKSLSTVRGSSACTVELINFWGFKWMVFYSYLYMSFHLECIFLWNTSVK